jgi:hypothetical protein
LTANIKTSLAPEGPDFSSIMHTCVPESGNVGHVELHASSHGAEGVLKPQYGVRQGMDGEKDQRKKRADTINVLGCHTGHRVVKKQ